MVSVKMQLKEFDAMFGVNCHSWSMQTKQQKRKLFTTNLNEMNLPGVQHFF